MATRTLAQLTSEVRLRADMRNTEFVTDSDVRRFITQSITDLYDLLLEHRGHEHYATSHGFNITSATASYSLPSNFYVSLGVDLGDTLTTTGAGYQVANAYALTPFVFAERNLYEGATHWLGDRLRYRYMGDNIRFSPKPSTSKGVTLHYVPYPNLPSATSDTWDGFNGWEEYVVLDAAMKCMEVGEEDTESLERRKLRVMQRIMSLGQKRDQGMPETITDMQAVMDIQPYRRHR